MSVLFEVFTISRRVDEVLSGALVEHGLNATEFGWYSLLLVEGPQTPTELTRRSGSPATTVSQVLRRLEERGHLRREPNPADARSTRVALTDAGDAFVRAALPAFREVLDRVHAELGDDVELATWGLARFDDALRTLTGAGSRSRDAGTRPDGHALRYGGEALTASEEQQVRDLIDFLRWRRG